MNWQLWCIVLALSLTTSAFECPKGNNCSNCQRYPEGIYELFCSTGIDDLIKVEIRPNDYVKLTCRNTVNWTKFDLGLSSPVQGIKSLSFNMCNLPKGNGLESLKQRLLTDDIEILDFSSELNIGSNLTRETLRGFNGIKKLTLTSNNLSNLSANIFQDLSSLTLLNLRDNNLHNLPKNFFRSSSLRFIELGNNKIETLDSSAFGELNELRVLNIWNNKVRKIFPKTFDKLIAIEALSLQRNNLETLPFDIFARLRNLRIVYLSQNNFTSLPADLLRNCENLESFVLFENRRNMTTMPNGFFSNLTKLGSVKLRKNGLTSLPEDLFWGTLNLHNVNLERNYLSTLPSKIFNNTHDLFTLDLSFNDLSSLPDDVFSSLRKLSKLDLSKNHLTTISDKLFSGLTSLRHLNMGRNDIVRLDVRAFSYLHELRVAIFSYNSLTLQSNETSVWGTLGSPFRSCRELEELHLDHNNISNIFDDWIYSTKLRVLNLAYNKLQLLKDEDLQFLSQGINVDLTHNDISHVNLNTVETWALNRSYSSNVIVSIENNPLECECKLYDLLRYLEGRFHPNVRKAFNLKIGNTKCTTPKELRDIAIADLRSKTLKCGAEASGFGNNCPKRCECYVRPENKAFLINCANVGISEAPRKIASPPDHQVELDLSRNSLITMPSFAQPGYEKITILLMNHNNISEIQLDTLPQNLTVLKLNNNKLTRMNQGIIDLFNNSSCLSELTLESNPWLCDCNARDFLKFILTKSSAMPDLLKITCTGSEQLYKMTTEELCPMAYDSTIVAFLGVTFFGLIVVLMAALYYRYQREIKVWLYAKNWCLWLVPENDLERDKIYDAFISYSHKDENFVVNEVLPKLEADPRRFKICVHFRDWIAGEWIPKQIDRSVKESRRTIVIMSPNFLESVWGRMEFRAAHSQALSNGRARVIIVLYDEIGPTENLDPELKAYLSMNTYIKWGDPWFWDKLKYAMPRSSEFVEDESKEGKNIIETTEPSINRF